MSLTSYDDLSDKARRAYEQAIKINRNADDTAFIRSLSGNNSPNEGNIRSILDSIYINGKNLADMLGEGASISDYANAVKAALDRRSNAFVTLMHKDSVFADPKAVIPDDDYGTPEAWAKAEDSLNYAAEHREAIYNAANSANNEMKQKNRDNLMLFSAIFLLPMKTALLQTNSSVMFLFLNL